MALAVKTRKEKGMPVIELVGRVIDVDVLKFTKKLEELSKKPPAYIVIDVSRSNFIDSHGLGSIVYYHNMLQKKSCKLLILNTNTDPNNYVTRLIELTNLNKVLNIVLDLEEIK